MNDVQTQPKPSGGAQKSAGSGGGEGTETLAYRSAYPPPAEAPTRTKVVEDLEGERDAQAEFNQKATDAQVEARNEVAATLKEAVLDADEAREEAEELNEADTPQAKKAAAKAIQELRAKKFPQPRK